MIDGTTVATELRRRVSRGVSELVAAGAPQPGLATVLVGDDPASHTYVSTKRKMSVSVGIADRHHHLPAGATQKEVRAVIERLALDPAVSGILLQLPLPKHLDRAALLDVIPPEKDVDGLTTLSAGRLARGLPGLRPCTPAGVMSILDYADIPIEGARATVVGRSELVGRPMAQLLTRRHATVTLAHRHTNNLERACAEAEILVVAAGVPHLIRGPAVRSGAAVIDVGIHRTESGLIGDVDTNDVMDRAGWVTPVPGGVGPMTIASLLANTLLAARASAGVDSSYDPQRL